MIACERVEVGARSALLRVTVALGEIEPRRAADAQLVVLIDGARRRRHRALPTPADAHAAQLTLGFAITRRAEVLELELDGRSLSLPEPVVRDTATLLAPGGAPATDADPDALHQQLRTTRARLEESRATGALLEVERDRAQQAAARAEAAAHDATARADALAGDPTAVPVAAGRRARRGPRRGAVVMCAIGSVALVGGILLGPGNGAGERGVSGAVAASPAGGSPVQVPAVFEALAQRLQIPAAYLALYRQTGARYGLDWTWLAAVGAIESHHGQSLAAGVASGANDRGASGPAQFLAGTWERFGVDGDGDGTRDVHDPADAIAAMASYLRASGAPQDWRGALRTYNHSDAYATAVERLAATYRSGAR